MNSIKKRSKYTALEKKSFPFVYLFIAFPVAQFLVFWLYVNMLSIFLAFRDINGSFSLKAFGEIWTAFSGGDRFGFELKLMLWRSIQIFLINNILVLGLNIILAYILTKKIKGGKIFRVFFMLPGIVGGVVFSSVMKSIYAYDGVLVELCKLIGIKLDPMIIRNGFLGYSGSAFSTMKWQTLIYGMTGANVIITGAYLKIPTDMFEAAKIDGAKLRHELFNVAIPCAWPTITMLFVVSLCTVFTSDYGAYVYSNGTGNPDMSTIGFYLYYLQVRIVQNNDIGLYSYVSALGLVITALTIPVVVTGTKIMNKLFDTVEF